MLWSFLLWVLFKFRQVLLPFGLAVLIAFIIEPAVEYLSTRRVRRHRVPRIVAILGIYVVVGVVIYIFAAMALPQIGHEVAKIGAEGTEIVSRIQGLVLAGLDHVEKLAASYGLPLERQEIEAFIRQNLEDLRASLAGSASKLFVFGRDVVTVAFSGVFGLFLVLMITAFLSMDRHRIATFAKSLVPPEHLWSYNSILGGIGVGLGGVVRGQVVICLTNGVLTFLGLWLLGVKFPIVLAILAATFSLIPIFGSIISTMPIVAVALTQSFAQALFALLWIIGIHLLEANILNPKIMGDATKIHPVIVVFVLVVGEQTSGLIGALFAVPVAAVVLTLFKFVHRRALEAERLQTASQPPAPARSGTGAVAADPVRAAAGLPPAPASPAAASPEPAPAEPKVDSPPDAAADTGP